MFFNKTFCGFSFFNTPIDFIKFRNTQENDKGPDYKNVVGQDDLKRFDKVFKKKKRKNSKKRKNPHNKARKNQ